MRKKILCVLLSLILGTSVLCACGGGSGSGAVKFWVYGDESELEIYTLMTEEFNATYGKENGIKVDISTKPPANYESLIQTVSTSKSGPDVFLVIEDNFKKWINMGFLADMTSYLDAVTDIDISDVYATTVDRLRYNIEKNTSNANDPLYGLPLDTKPSAIYYNETMFEKAGIIVISVDEKDMDAWNRGEIADNRGKKKSDFAKLDGVTVPKKGYFRSENPYTADLGFTMPSASEILVFNNRIAMNWDEVEDLSMIFTPSYNPNAGKDFGTDFGYFTEWWFNYGWSVGGDCLTDLSGNGDWNFSLLDASPNYYVAKDGFVGAYTGKTYSAGDTLSHLDKYDVPAGELMAADEEGGYTYNGSKIGIRATVTAAASEGDLIELPSTREAFTRYLKLGAEKSADIEGEGGLAISPNPLTFSTRTRMNYFYSGKMALLVDYSSYMATVSEQAEKRNFKWDVAPLVIYKQYVDPTDPYNDETVVIGKQSGQSNSKAMVSRENAQNKEAAAKFMKWMASKAGQAIRAEHGHFPNQSSLITSVKFPGYAPANVKAFSEALEWQGAGDWWYMPDYEWINVWAVPLNSEVRNGKMTYNAWRADAIKETNERLKMY